MQILTNPSMIILYGFALLTLSFIDNIIMSTFLNSIVERQSAFNFFIFSIMAFVNITCQGLIVYSIRYAYRSFNVSQTRISLTLQILMMCFIMLNIAAFSFLITQMIQSGTYDSAIFKFSVFSSYFFSLVFLGFLVQHFLSWYRKNANIIIMLYCVAFSIYMINEILSILILNIQLEIHPYKISFVPNPWDLTSLRVSPFLEFYKVSAIVSFSITWLATSLLMYHYSRKLGKRLFWLLTGLPMIYYVGNIDILRASLFSYLISYYPNFLSLAQFLLGGVLQIGGLFFALAFIALSKTMGSIKLKYYSAISATGLMLLFRAVRFL